MSHRLTEQKLSNELIQTQILNLIRTKDRVTTKILYEVLGNRDRVRYGLARLSITQKIRRIKCLGENGIDYYYKEISQG